MCTVIIKVQYILSSIMVYHERSKHIDIKYHFVKDIVEKGDIRIVKIGTEDNPADCFAKSLPSFKLRLCLSLINLLNGMVMSQLQRHEGECLNLRGMIELC